MTATGSKRSLWKRIRWLLFALAAGLLLWLGFRPQPVEVDTARIERGTLRVTVDEDGETRIREPYLISAPLAGRLIRVELEPGDSIVKGQVLAAIDPGEPGLLDVRSQAEAEARLKAAEAALRRAQSQAEIARAEVEKAERYVERDRQRLAEGNITAPLLADTEHALRISRGNETAAQSALDIARFEKEQAQAALLHSREIAEDETAGRQFEVVSPIDGVVLRRFQESATTIPAAERILEIGNPEDLEIRIDVLSEDAVKIRPGQRVYLENWGGPESLGAHIRRVEPSAFTKVSALGVDEQRVWVFADFDETGPPASSPLNPEIPSGGRTLLGDGYRVEARVIVWEKDGILKAPSGALFRHGREGDWAVYTVREGRAALTVVTRGRDNGIETEIVAGVTEGEQVVLHPGDRVEDGVTVRKRETDD